MIWIAILTVVEAVALIVFASALKNASTDYCDCDACEQGWSKKALREIEKDGWPFGLVCPKCVLIHFKEKATGVCAA